MKPIHVLAVALITTMGARTIASAQTTEANPAFLLGNYCCEMPSVGNVCVVFKADGTYAATGTLSHKDGIARGTWTRNEASVILTPKQETGCLVGYLTRFNIDARDAGSLTWLPKSPQDFARSGGAIVYPRYKKVNGSSN